MTSENTPTTMPPRQHRKLTMRLGIIILLLLGFVAYYLFTHFFTYSRDAHVFANVVNVTSFVPGHIKTVTVKDNQPVKQGDTLFTLDPRPYQYALDNAKARLEAAKMDYQKAKMEITTADKILQQRQVALDTALDHMKRYKDLVAAGNIADIIFIDVEFKVRGLKDEVAEAQQRLAIAKQTLTDARVHEAKAKLERAQYDLDQTIIKASRDGYVTNVLIEPGDFVNAGEPLFALVDTSEWWVITRYRETVLRRIKIGDNVNVHIDMYPGKSFRGVVDSIGWGINRAQASKTAAPSTLPYLEPTEYWVRIAQRFPVRIKIVDNDPNYPLRVGANAKTYVK
tara:strand:+ start:16521 stop:17537 length:1017 start_codon:yes stop_codon:yes gene_type:complete